MLEAQQLRGVRSGVTETDLYFQLKGNMKNLQSLLIAAVLFIATALIAGEHKSYSFLNSQVSSIQVSNAIGGWTNLASNGELTNYAKILWTNNLGTQFLTGTNTGLDSIRVLGAVPLLDNGGPWLTKARALGDTNDYADAIITVKLVGVNSAADSAVNLRFACLPDGVNRATDRTFVFPVVANGTTTVCQSTNVPLSIIGGSKALMLVSVDNSDQTANSAVWVQSVTLNGFGP